MRGARRGSLELARAAREDEEYTGFFSDQDTLLETIGERLGRIIERYEAEEALRRRERFSRITLASIGDAVVATDRDGRITLANSTAERLAGLSFEEARGKRVTELVELVDSRDGTPIPDPVRTVLDTDTAVQLSNHTLLRMKSGRELQVADSASPIKDEEDRTQGVVLVFRDETEQYVQQERLRRSEELNRSLVEALPIGITRVDRNGTVDFANRTAEEILGLTRDHITERSYNDPAWRITAVDGTPYVDELLPFRLVKDSGRPVHGIEHAIEWPGGERKLLSISGSPLFDAQGEFDGMISAIEDITERRTAKKAEKELAERVEAGLRAGNLAWWEMQLPSGKVIFDEHKANMLGYLPQQFETYHDFTALLHPEDHQRAMQAMRNHLEGTATVYEVEYRIKTSDGTYKWFRDVGAITEREARSGTIRVIGIVEDITERKRLEEELRTAVSDKTRLVREMNHRVKNNLAMVLSLVELKDDTLGDAADLSDIRSQIHAISFIHELLHQSADATHIEFGRYINDLLPRVFSFYVGSAVSLRTDIEETWLPSDTAVTLGLIVNELATNAVKHGFTGEEPPFFTVSLTRGGARGETYTLTVENSGRPLPEDVSLENADTLGLQLLSALVGQLRGTIDLQREPHPVFTIRF
ncbi:MAG: PAS domain S-box protein [Spirochaetaceae bacterium]